MIPPRLARRPVDGRGFPIPYFTFIRRDGKPDFRIVDAAKVGRCLRRHLCGLCGVRLAPHVYFIGGPASHKSGLFTDPPMHKDCALFALRTCPHLATAKGRFAPVADLAGEPGVVVRREISPVKAERFALMHCRRYDFGVGPGGLIIRAFLPWIEVRWFVDGEEIAVDD